MSVQKFIFPGILFGIFAIVGVANLLSGTRAPVAIAAPEPEPAAVQADAQPVALPEPAFGQCSLSGTYPDSVRQWCGLIELYAQQNNLDPNLISAVMLQESAGQPDAYSKSGAVGLMQVMPRDGKAAGFMCKNGPCFADRPAMNELFDPEYNIAYGTQMLAGLISRYGDVREALKAYGPMDVGYYYADLVIGIMSSHQ